MLPGDLVCGTWQATLCELTAATLSVESASDKRARYVANESDSFRHSATGFARAYGRSGVRED